MQLEKDNSVVFQTNEVEQTSKGYKLNSGGFIPREAVRVQILSKENFPGKKSVEKIMLVLKRTSLNKSLYTLLRSNREVRNQ
jgi:hypothetical protein